MSEQGQAQAITLDLVQQGWGVWVRPKVRGCRGELLVVEFGLVPRINVDEPAIWGEWSEVHGDNMLEVPAAIQGTLKAGGCMDWEPVDSVHFCEAAECHTFAIVLASVYELAAPLFAGGSHG